MSRSLSYAIFLNTQRPANFAVAHRTSDLSRYTVVQESGNDPVPALGGARPIDLMDTMEGQALVSTTLAQLQSGAYA